MPPKGWHPPFALDKGTNGQNADSFRFSIRKQMTSHLCKRSPNTQADRRRKAAGRLVLAPWPTCAVVSCKILKVLAFSGLLQCVLQLLQLLPSLAE